MIKPAILFTFLAASAAAILPAQNAFSQPGNVILVTPDGDILDYIPEAGEVTVHLDRRGRRVLVDHYGRVVAYELPAAPGNDRRFADRDFDRKNHWPPRPREWNWGDEPGARTGTIPQGRINRDIPVTTQPLPEPSISDSKGDRNIETTGLDPQSVEVPSLEEKVPSITKETKPPTDENTVAPAAEKNLDRETVTALQVLLDREGFSPGVIDGRMGDNVRKALIAWEATTGEKLEISNSEAILQRLSLDGGLPFTTYEITAADAAGPYVASIPADYAEKANLPALSYTSTEEKLAEQFHMDEDYLKAINPGVDFSVPGTIVKVVNPGTNMKADVARIVANKRIKQVQAFDEGGTMVAAYPATIGSSDTPSPSGTVTVERIALDPNYTYNPKINFQQGANTGVLTIPPGPNGPVGNVWIALSKPTYGIHGTPDPSKIGKTASHGCVRLTNWDARELAKMIKPGVVVQFVD